MSPIQTLLGVPQPISMSEAEYMAAFICWPEVKSYADERSTGTRRWDVIANTTCEREIIPLLMGKSLSQSVKPVWEQVVRPFYQNDQLYKKHHSNDDDCTLYWNKQLLCWRLIDNNKSEVAGMSLTQAAYFLQENQGLAKPMKVRVPKVTPP